MEETTKKASIKWEWFFDQAEQTITCRAYAGKQDVTPVVDGEHKCNEMHYSFHLERHRDLTKREILVIKVYNDGEQIPDINTNIAGLDGELLSLQEYGIVFTDSNNRIKLRRKIEQIYSKIEINPQKDEPSREDIRFNNLLDMVKEFIGAKQEDSDAQRKETSKSGKESVQKAAESEDLYSIPVSDFNEMTIDCGYKSYESQALRQKLFDKGYIRKVGNRYAVMSRYNNKPMRVIKFFKEKIDAFDPSKVQLSEEKDSQGAT